MGILPWYRRAIATTCSSGSSRCVDDMNIAMPSSVIASRDSSSEIREGLSDEGMDVVAGPVREPLVGHVEPVAAEHLPPADPVQPERVDEGAVAVEEQGLGALRRVHGTLGQIDGHGRHPAIGSTP